MVAIGKSAASVTLERKTSVLLIDDEAELSEFLAAELEAAEYHVEQARNGREALSYLKDAVPDLIVTDVMMPEMDGHEFLANLRTDPDLSQIPVIVLSNMRGVKDIVRGFELGADDYVTKPVDPDELLARVGAKVGRPPVPFDLIGQDRQSGLLSSRAFRHELKIEMQRAQRIGYPLVAAEVGLPGGMEPTEGPDSPLSRMIVTALGSEARPLDLLGRALHGGFLLAMPETTASDAGRRLRRIWKSLGEGLHATEDAPPGLAPAIGYARAAPGEDIDGFLKRLRAARSFAEAHPGHAPVRYKPAMQLAAREEPKLDTAGYLGEIKARIGDTLSPSAFHIPWRPKSDVAPAVARAPRILLLEDQPELAERIRAELEVAGYHVELVENGRQGLDHLNDSIPDLIITDVVMPEMDGLEFMSALRADPVLGEIPAVILTTKRKVADIVRGFDLGADDYVTKPVDPAELLARVRAKIARPPIPAEQLTHDPQSGFLSARAFRNELASELQRASRVAYPVTVAVIDFGERASVREQIGPGADAPLARQVAATLAAETRPFDLLGRSDDGRYLLLMPQTSEDEAAQRLERIADHLVARPYLACGETLHLTPVIGYAGASSLLEPEELLDRLRIAQTHAEAHLDLRPVRYEPAMVAPPPQERLPSSLQALKERLRLPAQIVATFVLGWLVPFMAYNGAAAIGHDVSTASYIVIVITLVVTCTFIWIEGFCALRQVEPPDPPDMEYPPASAIIAAYLPNEAATIISTLRAMLNVDYPGELQIILAYNTPKDMPIEKTLREMADVDPRLEVRRVVGSTSKAQNVNAVLSYVKGVFTAVYDADHHPDPDSFRRAWRWINDGADVVQGHCLIRNGDASWVARMTAVEFEQIYTVSHPGRARLHRFGIFGGSNGFWRTDLLRRTRFRGSMLTEDIDSALRVVEGGGRIVSDPRLISRELAPTTFKGLTHQRLRWAQGWYQVTKIRLTPALRSPHLSIRQKMGMFYLLAWRELFPWLSMQIVPLICFWAYQAGSFAAIDWFVPLFFVITVFVMTTGPGQIYFIKKLADPEIRGRRRWLIFYVFISTFMYAEYKNLLSRVANIKEWLKEKAWKVTARS